MKLLITLLVLIPSLGWCTNFVLPELKDYEMLESKAVLFCSNDKKNSKLITDSSFGIELFKSGEWIRFYISSENLRTQKEFGSASLLNHYILYSKAYSNLPDMLLDRRTLEIYTSHTIPNENDKENRLIGTCLLQENREALIKLFDDFRKNRLSKNKI